MSILFRIFGWVGGIVSAVLGVWFGKKMMQKATEKQGAAPEAEEAETEKKSKTA